MSKNSAALLQEIYRNVKNSYYLRRSSPVLLYHYVGGIAEENIHHVSRESFQHQLDGITKRFEVVFIDEFLDRLKKGASIKGLSCLTFDDATNSAVKYAIPMLQKASLPVTIFINSSFAEGKKFWRDHVRAVIDLKLETNFIDFAGDFGKLLTVKNFYADTKNINLGNQFELQRLLSEFVEVNSVKVKDSSTVYASVEELKIITSSLVQFGNHSARHLIMSGLTRDQQIKEIMECENFLVKNFEKTRISKVFSIPFGDAGSYNRDTFDALRDCDYHLALTSQSKNYFNTKRSSLEEGILLYNRFMPREYTRFYF